MVTIVTIVIVASVTIVTIVPSVIFITIVGEVTVLLWYYGYCKDYKINRGFQIPMVNFCELDFFLN